MTRKMLHEGATSDRGLLRIATMKMISLLFEVYHVERAMATRPILRIARTKASEPHRVLLPSS
jgi:hypothetical protein